MCISLSNIGTSLVLSSGLTKISWAPVQAQTASRQTVLQNSKGYTVYSGKPSGLGSPWDGLDPAQDIKEGFLEEVIAILKHGGRAI